MKQTLLLVACSCTKNKHIKKGRACDIYTGALFRLALIYSAKYKMSMKILSAKYGFIDPEQEIATYNQKLKKTYDGPWPKGSGFYVGGALYFANAPKRFKSLVPEAISLCSWVDGLRALCLGKKAKSIKAGEGITKFIYTRLLKSPVTKEQLFKELCIEFGDRASVLSQSKQSGMRQTINCQLRQSRIGVERNCTLHLRGVHYWVTTGLPKKKDVASFGL